MAKHQSEITAEILTDKDSIYKILQSQGYFFKEQFKMVDYYYTHIEITPYITYPELSKNSFVLREIVMKRRYVSGESSQLIYKQKKLDENEVVIGEIKHKCDIADTAAANMVLRLSGLNNWCIKSTTGHVFKRGDIELLVQEVEGLGFFLEVEEFEYQRGSNEQRIQELIAFAKGLGLPLGDDMHVKINYRLFWKRVKGKNMPARLYFGAP